MTTEEVHETRELWPSEILVTDVVGRLIEFWGFKRNMGRVWSVLYLSPTPVTAQELRDLLQLSAGAVSMTLNDLVRWGVVRKVWIQGDRRDHFTAEVQLWRMISRVFRERELAEITAAMEAFESALTSLEIKKRGSAEDRRKAALQIERIKGLLDLARMGKRLLEGLLSTAKIDAEGLARFVLSGRSSSSLRPFFQRRARRRAPRKSAPSRRSAATTSTSTCTKGRCSPHFA